MKPCQEPTHSAPQHGSLVLCESFNSTGVCSLPDSCGQLHVCAVCKLSHPATTCPKKDRLQRRCLGCEFGLIFEAVPRNEKRGNTYICMRYNFGKCPMDAYHCRVIHACSICCGYGHSALYCSSPSAASVFQGAIKPVEDFDFDWEMDDVAWGGMC